MIPQSAETPIAVNNFESNILSRVFRSLAHLICGVDRCAVLDVKGPLTCLNTRSARSPHLIKARDPAAVYLGLLSLVEKKIC